MEAKHFTILGAKVHELTNSSFFTIVTDWIKEGRKEFVVLTGSHGIIEMQSDEHLKKINHEASLSTPDGMPQVWLGKIKGYKNIEKVYAPTIMNLLFDRGRELGVKHYFYGGTEGVAELLTEKMQEVYPGIEIVGSYCPPFRPLTDDERTTVIHDINQSGANIVWCGLGCPKQDKWMSEFRGVLDSNVLIGVGAGFDFLSGVKPIAPVWVQNSGFEWLFRTISEPRRLLKRYSIIVPKFIYLNILELLGLKSYN